MLIKKKSTCFILYLNFLFCILLSQQGWSSVSLEEEPVDASLSLAMAGEVVAHPMSIAIPEIGLGHEEDYLRFINGILIYKPNKDNDLGRIEIPFSSLSNPLEGTFDLSECGDTGQYLSISTGYRKGKKAGNASKVEVWIVSKFVVEREVSSSARHLAPILGSFTSPLGLFWTSGGWDNMDWYDYLTSSSFEEISSENLYENYKKCEGVEFHRISAGSFRRAVLNVSVHAHAKGAERFIFNFN